MKALVSCIGKFHAFALSEQLQKNGVLSGLYTTYAWQKNKFMRYFANREDKENIESKYIHTNIPLAVLIKTVGGDFLCNDLFDRWVAWNISSSKNFEFFIGWSGMSLHGLRVAKRKGKITILERGSSHILHQNALLKEEYKKFDVNFSIDKRIIEKELKEYDECDFISIPSSFVMNSFVDYGIDARKLLINPYGTSLFFQRSSHPQTERPFRILYLGSLTIQKGLVYLFEALRQLNISLHQYEVWFIGYVSDELKSTIENLRRPNWFFWGHIPHYQLSDLVVQCDLGVVSSVQDGFGMVIPQMLGCGVPVIATTNTGGADIIREGETGFIVPIRSPEAIAEKIMFLYLNSGQLSEMKTAAAASVRNGFTWDDYGARYVSILKNLS